MPPTSTTDLTRDDLYMFDLMHRGMRVDSLGLRDAVAALAAGDRAGAARLRTWYAQFLAAIVHHHTVEDDIFWPGFAAIVPGFAEIEAPLTDDHHRLDDALDRVRDTLADLEASTVGPVEQRAATVACAALADLLHGHLDREEGSVFPTLLANVSAEAYEAVEAVALGERDDDRKRLAWTAAWMLDHCTPAEEARLRDSVPGILFVLERLVWRRGYRRVAAAVRDHRPATGVVEALTVV